MLSVTLLASGSSGNCAVVKTDDAQVLVDAGTPYKTLAARMAYLGLEPADTAAILVTHEHTDHVSGLRVAARRLDIPVYLSKGTDRKTAFTGDSHVVGADDPFTVRDLHVQPLAASHDAEEPLAFAFRSGDSRAAILTDTGIATPAMHKVVRKAQFLALEANHDEQVLMAGRYPAYLKQRILSDEGHLSNAQAGCLLME
ncbi:MBL fold metallo-hydrolase, partial [Candidatus Woesearchaeota archaeon CG11_big_fil_rev_8_21_14_0_20_57_5]